MTGLKMSDLTTFELAAMLAILRGASERKEALQTLLPSLELVRNAKRVRRPLDQLHHELADKLDAHPPREWSPGLCRAMNALLDIYLTEGLQERPAAVLQLVRPPDSPTLGFRCGERNLRFAESEMWKP